MSHLIHRAAALQMHSTKYLFQQPSIRLLSAQRYTNILTARPEIGVALVTLNRPKALNALSSPLMLSSIRPLENLTRIRKLGLLY